MIEKELDDLVSGLQRERHQVEPFYRAAARLVTPLYNHWGNDGKTNSTLKGLDCVFSNSGIRAAERFASFLLGMATPPSEQWFKLEDRDPEISDDHASRVWYSDAGDDVRSQLDASFYKAMRSANLEMSVSYGVVFSFEHRDKSGKDTGRVAFRHRPSHSIWYGLNAFGEIDCVAAMWELTKKEAQAFFKDADINAEEGLKSDTDRACFWHVVRRESDDDKLVKKTEDMPFQSYWLNPSRKKIVSRSGYNEMPYHIFRWEDVPGNTYSVGPTYAIFPEIKGANQAREDLLRALSWAGNPPVLMPKRESGVGRPTIGPGKRIYGGTNSDGKSLYTTMNGMANPSPLLDATIDAEARVRDGLFNHEMMNVNNKDMTATEASFRQQERAHMMGPFAVALHEPLESVLQRTLKIRARAGRLPEPPPILMERGDYSVRMVGPLAQAVQQGGIATVLGALQQILLLAEFDPSVMDVVDAEAAARMIMDRSGVDPQIERSEDEVSARKSEAEAAQAAIMEGQMQEQQAGAIRNVAGAVRDVSNAVA